MKENVYQMVDVNDGNNYIDLESVSLVEALLEALENAGWAIHVNQ